MKNGDLMKMPPVQVDTRNCKKRDKDTRRAYKVEYEGVKYTDVTEFFAEGFYNGDQPTLLSRKHAFI